MKISSIFCEVVISLFIHISFNMNTVVSTITLSLNKIQGMYKNPLDNLRKLDHLTSLLGNSTPIFGNSSSLNYYYVNIHVGIPPQRQSVIIDTGSQLTAIPCMPHCTNCGKHINPYYNTQNSNESMIIDCNSNSCKQFNFAKCVSDSNKCSYSMTYGEGSSLTGIMIEDYILFGDTFHEFKPVKLPFGCTITENQLFYEQQVDGIMGLGPSEYSFVSLLYKKGIIQHQVFTLCYASDGGYLSVGGINKTLHTEEIKYIQFYQNQFYKVKLRNILVNSMDYKVSESEFFTIIDSGTTISYFPKIIYDKIGDNVNKFCSQINKCMGDSYSNEVGLCYKLKENINIIQFIESMPIFTFVFENNVKYHWKPQNYLFNYTEYSNNDERLTFCIGFNSWSKNEILLGSTWMHNHDIIFDIQHHKIGLVESNCAANNLMKVGPGFPNPRSPKSSDSYFCDLDSFFIFTSIVVVIFIIIIILLFIALFKIRRGQNFLWIRISSEDSNISRELNKHEDHFKGIIKSIRDQSQI